jgi:hypothetical protein
MERAVSVGGLDLRLVSSIAGPEDAVIVPGSVAAPPGTNREGCQTRISTPNGRFDTFQARLARPGGHVLLQEPDTTVRICYPPHPAWAQMAELFQTVVERDGADSSIGRELPTLLREAGLVDIGVEARADIYCCVPIPCAHRSRRSRTMSSTRARE